jgi:hypothetical protein
MGRPGTLCQVRNTSGYGSEINRFHLLCVFSVAEPLVPMQSYTCLQIGGRAARRAPTRKVRESLSRRSKG